MEQPPQFGQSDSGGGFKIPILFGAVLALVGSNVYQFVQIDKMKTEITGLQKSTQTELAGVKERTEASAQTQRRNIDALQAELAAAQRRADSLAGQAKVDAQKHAEELASKLRAEQERQSAALKGQISDVKKENEATNQKVGEVNAEVGNVKTEVSNAKQEIEKTIANLKRVQGELGDQGSLIATNGKELAALKALGERNYFEFRLNKAKQASKVGDIALLLKKTDPKKNRFTVEVIADDKNVEKRDRTVNEPIQFLTSKARQPYEIVVNEVGKDVIAGYLATPKVTGNR
jgi:chromosome segregation ATPase